MGKNTEWDVNKSMLLVQTHSPQVSCVWCVNCEGGEGGRKRLSEYPHSKGTIGKNVIDQVEYGPALILGLDWNELNYTFVDDSRYF